MLFDRVSVGGTSLIVPKLSLEKGYIEPSTMEKYLPVPE